MSKHCPVCDQDLDIAAFPADPRGLLGVLPICRSCLAQMRRSDWVQTQERLSKRPAHSKDAAKKKCPACRKYVYVEPGSTSGTCYVCGKGYHVIYTLGSGTTPNNAHGIRLQRLDIIRKTRGK